MIEFYREQEYCTCSDFYNTTGYPSYDTQHDNHPGITRMKALAHSYFWWIGLDKDIESMGKSCEKCQAAKSNPTAAPLHLGYRLMLHGPISMLTTQDHPQKNILSNR